MLFQCFSKRGKVEQLSLLNLFYINAFRKKNAGRIQAGYNYQDGPFAPFGRLSASYPHAQAGLGRTDPIHVVDTISLFTLDVA